MSKPNKILILVGGVMFFIGYLVSMYDGLSFSKEQSLFDMRERCIGNRENVKKILSENYVTMEATFQEVFYSRTAETCVYAYKVRFWGQVPNETGAYIIVDYFTGKQLNRFSYDNSTTDTNQHSSVVRDSFMDVLESYRN